MLLLSLLLGHVDAKSKVNRPYMYGWGPSAHTMLYPFQYPYIFPKGKDELDPPNAQLDKMRQDLGFGPKFTMHINHVYRVAAYPHVHLGANDSGYKSAGLSLEADASVLLDNSIAVFYGLGGGSSLFTFDQGQNGTITGQQLYLKGQAGGIYYDGTKAYELSIYAKLGVTGVEKFEYNGAEYENSLGTDDQLSRSLYTPTFGIQGTYYFGDFRKIQSVKGKPKKWKLKKFNLKR
jgi:hypothetical protein